MTPQVEKIILEMKKARDLYRELETAGRLLEKTPATEWNHEKLQGFQERRKQLFTALEKVNTGINAMSQPFPSAAEMPAEVQALIRDQLELIKLIQQHDRKLLTRGQVLQQQLAPLLKHINVQRKLFKEYQPDDQKNPPPPRFFKATV